MSVHMTSRVWLIEGLTPVEKLVLLKLADHAGDSGEDAYPSVARVAKEVGCSERTVQRTLKDLWASGLIEVTAPATRHRPTCYRLRLENRGANLSPLDPVGVTSTTFRGDTATSPEPSIEPSLIPSESPKRSLSNPKRPFTDGDRKAFIAEFHALPDVEGSIRKAMNSPGYQFGTDKYGHVRDWLLRDCQTERERRQHATTSRNLRPGAQPQRAGPQAQGTHPGRAPDVVV